MQYLRVFHYKNTETGMVYNAGRIYSTEEIENSGDLTDDIQDFFNKHTRDIIDSKRTRSSRFKNTNSPFLTHLEGIFESYEMFDDKSQAVNLRFFNRLTQAERKDFLFILFDGNVDGDRCLVILTMEAKNGIQLSGDILSIINDLLPDSGAKSKKAAVIFEEKSMTYKNGGEELEEENDTPIRHAVVIDRQTPDITNLFTKFLDSEIIPDQPTEVTKILLKVFPKVLGKYLRDECRTKDIQDEIRNMFSVCRESNFDDVTSILKSKLLSEEKLNNDNVDVETLSAQAFREARIKSSAINNTFTAESSRFSKNIFKDLRGGKNIKLIISEASIEDGDVVIDRHQENDDEPFVEIKVKKDVVRFEKTI